MDKFDNNRAEYHSKGILFTVLMSGGLAIVCWLLYNTMLQEDPDGGAILLIGVLSALVFGVWHIMGMNALLNIPETKADKLTKSQITNNWSMKYGVSFGGVFAVVMVIGTLLHGELSGALPAIIFGCPLFGIIAYYVAKVVAKVIAPKEYLPWLTQEGYQAYLRREEERRIQAQIRAARLAGQMQSTYVSPTPSTAPPATSSSSSGVRGRVYQGQFSGSEIGYYTSDTIYKTGSMPLSDVKVGTYRNGMIDDDSGIISAHTIGRYVWDSVYNGYLLYEGNSKEKFVGRVLRNGEIQTAKHPDYGALGNLVSSIEYKTIGRYTGDPEGAAAAAYLLLFR